MLSRPGVLGCTNHLIGHLIAARLEGLQRSVSDRILQTAHWLGKMGHKGLPPITIYYAVLQSAELLGTAKK